MKEYLYRNTAIKNAKLSEEPQDINNNSGVFQVSVRRQNDCMVSGWIRDGWRFSMDAKTN